VLTVGVAGEENKQKQSMPDRQIQG
jgi:hypothetical protein